MGGRLGFEAEQFLGSTVHYEWSITLHVSAEVWEMVQLEVETGARSGELVELTASDVERKTVPWAPHQLR